MGSLWVEVKQGKRGNRKQLLNKIWDVTSEQPSKCSCWECPYDLSMCLANHGLTWPVPLPLWLGCIHFGVWVLRNESKVYYNLQLPHHINSLDPEKKRSVAILLSLIRWSDMYNLHLKTLHILYHLNFVSPFVSLFHFYTFFYSFVS